jgi:hypothetical protein
MLCEHFSASHYKMATPLKQAAAAFFGRSEAALEKLKDIPARAGYSATYRDIDIGLSEKVIKPLLGDDYFGILCAVRINTTMSALSVVSDSGFHDEVSACSKHARDPDQIIWHVMRDNTSFDNDSRDWVHVPGIPSFQIFNSCCKKELEERVCALYKESERLFSSSR